MTRDIKYASPNRRARIFSTPIVFAPPLFSYHPLGPAPVFASLFGVTWISHTIWEVVNDHG